MGFFEQARPLSVGGGSQGSGGQSPNSTGTAAAAAAEKAAVSSGTTNGQGSAQGSNNNKGRNNNNIIDNIVPDLDGILLSNGKSQKTLCSTTNLSSSGSDYSTSTLSDVTVLDTSDSTLASHHNTKNISTKGTSSFLSASLKDKGKKNLVVLAKNNNNSLLTNSASGAGHGSSSSGNLSIDMLPNQDISGLGVGGVQKPVQHSNFRALAGGGTNVNGTCLTESNSSSGGPGSRTGSDSHTPSPDDAYSSDGSQDHRDPRSSQQVHYGHGPSTNTTNSLSTGPESSSVNLGASGLLGTTGVSSGLVHGGPGGSATAANSSSWSPIDRMISLKKSRLALSNAQKSNGVQLPSIGEGEDSSPREDSDMISSSAQTDITGEVVSAASANLKNILNGNQNNSQGTSARGDPESRQGTQKHEYGTAGLRGALKKARSEVEGLKSDVKRLESDLSKEQSDLESLQKRAEQAENKLEEQREEAKKREEETAKKTADVEQQYTEQASIQQTTINTLKSMLRDTLAQKADLDAALAKQKRDQRDLPKLRDENAALQREKEALERESASLLRERDTLMGRLETEQAALLSIRKFNLLYFFQKNEKKMFFLSIKILYLEGFFEQAVWRLYNCKWEQMVLQVVYQDQGHL